MGNTAARDSEIQYYPIKLTPRQSAELFGLLDFKTVLTWRDVLQHKQLTFLRCLECDIPTQKLHRMQPSLSAWVKNSKAGKGDIDKMAEWRPNPFTDFGCTLECVIMHRSTVSPETLCRADITVDQLRDRYGLTADSMVLLRYSLEQWLSLGLQKRHVEPMLSDEQAHKIFSMSKGQLLDRVP